MIRDLNEVSRIVSLTVPRGEEDLTVTLENRGRGWVITLALDENGRDVVLTEEEIKTAKSLAAFGFDETGY